MADKQFGTIDGVACQVRREAEGSSKVLRFRFDRGDGVLIPIELRGDDVRGDLDSGDRVEITITEKDKDETGIRLKRIINLSTGYSVQVWGKSRVGRIGSFISENASTAAIATLVTALVSFLLTAVSHLGAHSSPISPPGIPPTTNNGQLLGYYAVLAAVFNAVVFIILYWRLRRGNKKRGIKRRLWPYLKSRHMLAISGGLVAGELLTTLILWITQQPALIGSVTAHSLEQGSLHSRIIDNTAQSLLHTGSSSAPPTQQPTP